MDFFARIWKIKQGQYLELLEENRLLKEQLDVKKRRTS
jgi:hypothetical protein